MERDFEKERQAFADSWVLAGRVEDVPGPGNYYTWEKTRVPLLIPVSSTHLRAHET